MFNRCFRVMAVATLALAVGAITPTASLAQPWPTHSVRFVLPFGPGSGADTAARLITEKLQQKWGQSVIIDGKPGGDGLLSLQAVVSAKDDHTLFFGPSSIFVVQERGFCDAYPKAIGTSRAAHGIAETSFFCDPSEMALLSRIPRLCLRHLDQRVAIVCVPQPCRSESNCK